MRLVKRPSQPYDVRSPRIFTMDTRFDLRVFIVIHIITLSRGRQQQFLEEFDSVQPLGPPDYSLGRVASLPPRPDFSRVPARKP
jgi:hypothetical protein